MITRRDVIADAADKCMKELYSLAQPTITWEDFIKENKEFIKREEEYYKLPKENKISYKNKKMFILKIDEIKKLEMDNIFPEDIDENGFEEDLDNVIPFN